MTGGGERVSPLVPNDLYYAHLSLYAFCEPWAAGRRVLDLGCGTGYGAAHLAARGAGSVVGIDVDAPAVEFARGRYAGPGLRFARADLSRAAEWPDGPFDLLVALNVLEHVPDLEAVLRAARERTAPGAAFIAAVPPVTTPTERLAELANPHHLNIWTPRQWALALGRYYARVALYRHDFLRQGAAPDFRNAPGESAVRETDFACRPVASAADLAGTFSVLLVAAEPLPCDRLPRADEPMALEAGSLTRSPPRLAPLPPDLLSVPARPWSERVGRGRRLLQREGLGGLLREARSWLVWRVRRGLAMRELRRTPRR